MKKLIKFVLLAGIIVLFQYCSQKPDACQNDGFQKLDIYPVKAQISIPKYRVIDSAILGEDAILNYNISTLDSVLNVFVFVNKSKDDQFSLDHLADVQKSEIQNGRDSSRLITQVFREEKNARIGYLKYFVSKDHKKFFDGRIFFEKQGKIVTIWLLEMREKQNFDSSKIDCIFRSLTLN